VEEEEVVVVAAVNHQMIISGKLILPLQLGLAQHKGACYEYFY
jgi:hypothetical protein